MPTSAPGQTGAGRPVNGDALHLVADGAAIAPAAWDAFVAGARGSSFCHLHGWREVMEEVMGARCHFRAAADEEGAIRGVLPLVEVSSRLFGRFLVSMPFLNYGGPLGDPGAQQLLVAEAVRLAERSGARLLELRSRAPVPGGLAVSDRKVLVTLPLPATVDELWKSTFKAKLRSQVRRPIKEGLTARFGPDQAEPFYAVFARNMRDLGTPVLPRAFFERLPRLFPEQVVFGCVWHGDTPVAAGCGFVWQGEFEITWASALREFSRSAPNMLLYAATMEEMIRRGVGTFNFGRSTPGAGTHRFKLQWGGADTPLPWAQWSPDGTASTPSPESRKFQLATRAWQRLPLPVANRIGPLLSRRIP